MAKSWWQNFVDKLAAANEKEYGNDVPECCGEGKTKKQVNSTKNHVSN